MPGECCERARADGIEDGERDERTRCLGLIKANIERGEATDERL